MPERAELWRWCGLWRRLFGDAGDLPDVASAAGERPPLAAWPVERPVDWTALVNRPQPVAEEESLRASIRRGRPFGSEAYQAWTSEVLELASTYRPRGRPRGSGAEVMSEKDS